MTNPRYIFDETAKFWHRAEQQSLRYSDGDEQEEYLFSILKNAQDVSSTSQELIDSIRDWPSEYHLSLSRHNLLRPININQSHHVLEIGCGCGSITRYLGETGAKVTAVEGSQRRAKITAARCRDLENVQIYCETLSELVVDTKFDYVTLIGVLEYAPKYIDAPDPVKCCLELARSFLKEDGVLVLAIENQLGLKYFNGYTEDHVGIPFFGIYDLYGADTPITLGKQDLTIKLNSVGFTSTTFYYPFPDYKLPTLVLSNEALRHPNFNVSDLLYRSISTDYSLITRRVFHENMAWQAIIRNGLLPELANSFLVLARNTEKTAATQSYLAYMYNTERAPCFATETVFQSGENGQVSVQKKKLFPEQTTASPSAMHLQHHPNQKTNYVVGRLYASGLQSIMARGGGALEIAEWAKPWIEILHTKSVKGVLPGDWLDATPANFILDKSNHLILIDTEWHTVNPIPMSWVLIRGFVNALTICPPSPKIGALTFREVLNLVLKSLGYSELKNSEFKIAGMLESALQKCTSKDGKDLVPLDTLTKQKTYLCGSPLTVYDQIAEEKREVFRVKTTFSWRVTAPLRLLWNVFLKPINSVWLLKRNVFERMRGL